MKQKIKLLIMDVDGTITDGRIYIGNNGEVFKAFNIKDGYGIKDMLKTNGITPVIITGRKSKIVVNRCLELGIDYLFQNVSNKLSKLIDVLDSLKCSPDQVAYIGDDDNDLEAIRYVMEHNGIAGCPSDSSNRVLATPGIYVCKLKGGNGAVREYIEHVISII